MNKFTRKKFSEYLADQATLNGVADVTQQFTVDPSIEQRIVDETQASASFLQKINMVLVSAQQGESLGLSVSPNASRTNTKVKDRQAKSIVNAKNIDSYFCKKTDFDVAIPYALMDSWAHRPEFQKIMSKRLVQQMAIDKLTIGFHGKASDAPDTDRAANPMGEDINIGWLTKVRAKTERVMTNIEFGADKAYKNLDAVVMDAASSLLDPWYRSSSDIVSICSPTTAMLKYFDLINRMSVATDMEAAQRLLSELHFGMKGLVLVDECPDYEILITSVDNLSIYTQESSTRKTIVDNAKRDQVETYQSQNDAYVVEDFGKTALVSLKKPTPPTGA